MNDPIDWLSKHPVHFCALCVVLCVCVTSISSCAIQSDKHLYEYKIEREKARVESDKAFWDQKREKVQE